MNNLDKIKSLLLDNQTDIAISQLTELATNNPNDDNIFFLLGNAYCKENNWQQALNAYCQAIEINPDSPARLAYEHIQEIMSFFNHDLYNP